MRIRPAVPAVAVIAALTMTACSTGEEDVVVETVVITEGAAESTPRSAPQPTSVGDPEPTPRATSEGAFCSVLLNPPTMAESRESRFHPTGAYSYAFVEATGDDSPYMLLRIEGEEFSRVLVYTLDDSGAPVAASGYLIDGAAGVGGSRARVLASASGAGVYQIDYQSVRPEGTSALYRLEGDSLVKGPSMTVEALSTPPDHVEIDWRPVTGRARPDSQNTTTFTGTVREKSTSEVMKGLPVPNGEPESNRYYVLELDAPMTITGRSSGGGFLTRTITDAALGLRDEYSDNSARWVPLVESRVSITADNSDLWFPSDTGLPLGMLRISPDATVSAL